MTRRRWNSPKPCTGIPSWRNWRRKKPAADDAPDQSATLPLRFAFFGEGADALDGVFGSLDAFIHWDKDFVGKQVALAESETGAKKKLVTMIVDTDDIF
jgi:hypothetical protein